MNKLYFIKFLNNFCYIIFRVLFFFVPNSVLKNKKETAKVLFISSKSHIFSQKMAHTGTSIIASKIINYYSKNNIFLIDQNESLLGLNQNLKYDLIIGLPSRNFLKYSIKNFKADKILLCVNSNPHFRNDKIIEEKKRIYKKISSLKNIKSELTNPLVSLFCILLCNKIIVTGNNFVLNTYLKQGVSKEKIFKVCHFLKQINITNKKYKLCKKKTYLYCNSDSSIRKNTIFFLESWIKISKQLSDSKLVIIGRPVSQDIKQRIIRLVRKMNNVKFIDDFLNYKQMTKHYLNSDFYINISLEEGQVFTALEAIKFNCIPICSINCGLNLDESFTIKDPTNYHELKNKILKLHQRHEFFLKRLFVKKKKIQVDSEKYSIRNTLDKFYAQN